MRLDIIRHGKTEANKKRIYCGHADLSLLEEGERELQAYLAQGIYQDVQHCASSSSRRALQTLKILYDTPPHIVMPELCEYNFGKFEMKDHDTLKEDPLYIDWIMDQTGDVRCPSGESRNEFRARVQSGFQILLQELGKNEVISACLVCHGGTIAEIMDYLLPGQRNFYDWQPQNGRGYSLLFSEGHTGYEAI